MSERLSCSLAISLLLIALPAAASEIYKRVNPDGVIEFSDRPLTNGNRVDVSPNVVVTSPVQRRARPAASPATAPAPQAATPAAPSSRVSTADDNSNAQVAESQARQAREQRNASRDPDDATASDPNPGRALRNAARAVSAPR